jgi:hypothetical protein
MKKYRTGGWGKELIEEVEVERETEQCVWIKRYPTSKEASRHAKRSSYDNFFDTWEEAHAYLREQRLLAVESAKRQLVGAEKLLANIDALKRPE